MATVNLSDIKVAILATDGVEEVELTQPKMYLEESGARTAVIAPHSGSIQGFHHDRMGNMIVVDAPLSEADPADFDAMLLPGGVINADRLRMEPQAQSFAQYIDAKGLPIAVICHGPWLLVSAGLAKGRHLTSFYTLQDDIRNAGATWTDDPVVADGNWVSSRGPADIPQFNPAMADLFRTTILAMV